MFSFRRKSPNVAAARQVLIEGLEGRRLLSGSIMSAGSSHGGGGGPGPSLQVPQATVQVQAPSSGTIVSVDAVNKTITVSAQQKGQPAQFVLTVAASATITADGAPVALGALLPGANVSLTANSQNPATVTAIRAVGSDVEGKVIAVNPTAGTLTLTGEHGGAPGVFAVPSAASIIVNGAPGALSGILIGAEVHLHLSALDDTTVASIVAKNPDAHDLNDVDPEQEANTAEGTVTAVDLTAGKITLAGEHAGATTAFAIPAAAKITIDGKPGTLAGIAIGSKAEIHFSATDPTVIVSVEVKSAA